MNETADQLVFRLVGDATSYLKMMTESEAATKKTAAVVVQSGNQIEAVSGSLQGFGQSVVSQITAAIGVTTLLGVALKGIRSAAQEEANVVDFGTMLRSMEAGQQMIRDIQVFAAATPLGQGDIQSAVKTLLQFGVAGKDVMGIVKQLGDVTGGEATRFSQMALAMGQVQSTGRLMGQDLLQMINAGFNPLQEMSRTTGKSMAFLKDEMEKGRISVDMVRRSFVTATSEGGAFAGLMEKRSKTLSGLFSTMQDDVEAATREIGKQVIESLHLKDALENVSSAAQWTGKHFAELPGPIKTLVIGSGALAAGLGAVSLIAPQVVAGVTAIAAASQRATLALVTNPVAWVVGAAAAFVILRNDITMTSDEMERMNEVLLRSKREFDSLQASITAQSEKRVEGIGKMGDRRKQVAAFEEEGQRLAKSLAAQEDELKKRNISSLPNFMLGAQGRLDAQAFEANIHRIDAIKAAQQRLTEAREKEQKVTAAGGPGGIAADKFIEKLKEEAATVGMAAEQVEKYKLAKMGLDKVRMNQIDDAIMAAKVAKDWGEAVKAIDTLIQNQRQERANIGLTPMEAAVKELKEKFADPNVPNDVKMKIVVAEAEIRATERAKEMQKDKNHLIRQEINLRREAVDLASGEGRARLTEMMLAVGGGFGIVGGRPRGGEKVAAPPGVARGGDPWGFAQGQGRGQGEEWPAVGGPPRDQFGGPWGADTAGEIKSLKEKVDKTNLILGQIRDLTGKKNGGPPLPPANLGGGN